GASIDLVESNRKKASFLQAVVGQFNLPARVVARRIDDAYAVVSAPQIVTARALAALPVLLELAAPWLMAGACGLFHKGRDYRTELAESAQRWSFDLVEHASATDAHGVILELSDLRPLT
ncbi:MAG: 16S rRNA (guanine(527)-N(7))-methyltransferase RsmG, partial [Mesorhizobium sp.]